MSLEGNSFNTTLVLRPAAVIVTPILHVRELSLTLLLQLKTLGLSLPLRPTTHEHLLIAPSQALEEVLWSITLVLLHH